MYKDGHPPSTFLCPSIWLQQFSVGLTFISGKRDSKLGKEEGKLEVSVTLHVFSLFQYLMQWYYILKLHVLSHGPSLHCVFDKLSWSTGSHVERWEGKSKWREWHELALTASIGKDSVMPRNNETCLPHKSWSISPPCRFLSVLFFLFWVLLLKREFSASGKSWPM